MIVSSIGGRVAQPMIGAYTSSKWAATAMGLSLRIELRRHGIGVTVLAYVLFSLLLKAPLPRGLIGW